MNADQSFARAVTMLAELNNLSRHTHNSDANLEYLQFELFNTISNMVSINRQNAATRAMAERMQHAIAQGNVTIRRPTGPYTTPLLNRRNPLEKTVVIAKKKLDSLCPDACAICQETPKYKDAVCTECEHYYCKICWNSWMTAERSNKKCPTCRKDMPRTTSYKVRGSKRLTGPMTEPMRRQLVIIEDDEENLL